MNGMPPAVAATCRLHAMTPEFRDRVARAEAHIADWLSRCQRPYVAFSGGKDSTSVLYLVRAAAQRLGRPAIPAVYFDAACAFPEVDALLDATPDLLRVQTAEPFLATLAAHGLQSDTVERATMRATVWEPARRIVREHGFDGCAYGLRAEEAVGRRRLRRVRGAVFFSSTYGVWQAQPIAEWSYWDVWAYIVSRRLVYAGTYDRMWDLPEREQRVSYWAGESNRTSGRYVWLRRNYPALFRRLAETIPEARAFA